VIGARHARSFRSGRQEDAHEYLVGLLDAMHEGALAGLHPRPPRETAETSFIYRIFGGRLRSQARRPRRATPAAGHMGPACCYCACLPLPSSVYAAPKSRCAAQLVGSVRGKGMHPLCLT